MYRHPTFDGTAGTSNAPIRETSLQHDERDRAQLAAQPAGHRPGDEFIADPAIASRILQTVSTSLLIIDGKGLVRSANRAAYELLGAIPDDVLGRRWDVIADGVLNHGALADNLHALVRGEHVETADVEVELVIPGRGTRWCAAKTGELARAEGNEQLVLLALDDNTGERSARLAADSWRKELERSNRELEQFASVAAHDLQEPVRKILSFGERLQRQLATVMTPEPQETLDRILAAAGRARSMIGGILALSRASTRPLIIERVDLAQVARDVMADLDSQLERDGGQVIVGALPIVNGDALLLRQLMQNLVSNGLKFRRPDTPAVVDVSSRREQSAGREVWVISVHDNGIGFEERFLPQLFQPFTRLNPRSAYEGHGIGLALCHRVVERHGGTIAAASVPGGGSTFSFTLPVTGGSVA